MRNLRPTASVVAGVLLLALAGCGAGGIPTPSSSGSSTASPSPDGSTTPAPTPTEPEIVDDEGVAAAAGVVVTGESLAVYAVDGAQLFGTLYVGDVEPVIEILTELLGAPTVTTTLGLGSGCDADQTTYDYGGLRVRSPGFVGSVGSWEVEVTAAATAGGVPISTVGGQQIGAARAAFEAAIGDEVLIGDYPPTAWLGFDIVNPEVAEYDWIGSIARFDSGTLVQVNVPYFIHSDC